MKLQCARLAVTAARQSKKLKFLDPETYKIKVENDGRLWCKSFAPETFSASSQLLPQIQGELRDLEEDRSKLMDLQRANELKEKSLKEQMAKLQKDMDELKDQSRFLKLETLKFERAADVLAAQGKLAASVFTYKLDQVQAMERDLETVLSRSGLAPYVAAKESKALQLLQVCDCEPCDLSCAMHAQPLKFFKTIIS
jgi:DNA repair exonuclease SbcCD ATPase subunit